MKSTLIVHRSLL